MRNVLIVDDDRTQRRMVSAILEDNLGLRVIEAKNGRECLEILSSEQEFPIRLVMLDLDMPVMNGLETLPEIIKTHPDLPVIVLTGTRSVESAAEAIKLGATDFFSKPVQPERIIASAKNALKLEELTQELSRLQRQASDTLRFSDLTGTDRILKPVLKIAAKAASSSIPVLITGETGVGKEVFARAIHGESERSGRPFIAVNCGAIPENLVESTLFGHEKGAFTGAVKKTLGKFREAEGGTIFLDEVGELPLDAQVKLLRVLQEHDIEPVGAGQSVKVDVRIISATNRNLEREIIENRFREDLYFRLNVLPLPLPALRERKTDIPALSRYFVERFSVKDKNLFKTLSPSALQKLESHDWPGNIRELENTINRSLILCDGEIMEAEDIAFFNDTGSRHAHNHNNAQHAESIELNTSHITDTVPVLNGDGSLCSLSEVEKRLFTFAIQYCGGNIPQAAKALGIAKSTLYRKLNASL